jgi:ParB family chromosome partitioning protein
MAKASKVTIRELAIDVIDEPRGRIRLEIDPESIAELAANIAEVGLLQPIIVRSSGERFEIVAGHRRYLAFQLLKKKRISAIVRDLDDVACALARASENLGRVDLSPIEEAAIYSDLRDEHKLTIDEIGKRMGKTVGVVKRRLDLLKMPDCLQKAIHSKQIGYSVAEELWSLGDIGKIDYYLGFAVDHGATLAVVRVWVQDEKKKARTKESGADGSESLANPMQSRPVYVACDLCLGSMELGTETTIRACEVCTKAIKKVVES